MERRPDTNIFTRHLVVHSGSRKEFRVSITDISPVTLLQHALTDSTGVRYSPIFPAYLMPDQTPPAIPSELTSVAFFFVRCPYKALGRMKPELAPYELERIYFSTGLASILCVNCDIFRARQLLDYMCDQLLEYWPIHKGLLDSSTVIIEGGVRATPPTATMMVKADYQGDVVLYVEQILASIVALRQSYAIYNPEELNTLDRIARYTESLMAQHRELSIQVTSDLEQTLLNSRKTNSITSALAELSASLSYAVTQGTSGSSPILANPSPFPHFSLLGIGGWVRAITKFTRYLESAFSVRDAFAVITQGYSCHYAEVPFHIKFYNSGDEYKFFKTDDDLPEEFDLGGQFPQEENIPLIAYFSLRHGFKESKFSLTAAAETLTNEMSPQWTIMTLSHEIMHNRVRLIFQALFGSSWDQDRDSVLTEQYYLDFKECYDNSDPKRKFRIDSVIRNAVLNFCCAMDRARDIRRVRRIGEERDIPGLQDLCESYCRQKLRAVELFVHFHDYYFAYACQPKMYTMSLWASWIKVAAPYARPMDYLVRTLATLACGTGLEPRASFEYATETLDDALSFLERSGLNSPLFQKIRDLQEDEKTYAYFKLSYFLIDQVQRFFASCEITSRIDRIEDDPFSEGSTSADDYSANVFVYGEDDSRSFVSPIRFSLASLLRSILGQLPIKDTQWMTAWNAMVISSQEVSQC